MQAAALTPEQLRKLTKRERRKLLVEAQKWERENERLLDFIPRVTPQYRRPDHLSRVSEVLERARDGERVRACVAAPPRHCKSELLLHGVPYYLAKNPSHLVGYLTYAQPFANDQSRKAKTYALASGFVIDGVDQEAQWRNTREGGCIAMGIGGPAMGRGFNLLIVDDPHKSRLEAESVRERANVIDLFKGTLVQRMEPGGSIIVTHQRWNDDDLIGTLLEDGGWEDINLPAIDAEGHALCPWRYDLAALEAIRRGNEYNWWSQYMGSPRPKGGKVFKREPRRFEGSGKDGRSVVLAVDAAGTESTRADFTVGIALAFSGRGPQLECNIVDMVRVQLEPPDAAKVLRDFQLKHGGAAMLIEATRDGKSIAKTLRSINSGLRLEEVPAIGDKFLRAQGLAAAWNDERQSRVSLPADALSHPWVVDLLAEFRLFTGTGDKHDDIVDAASHAWNAVATVPDRRMGSAGRTWI